MAERVLSAQGTVHRVAHTHQERLFFGPPVRGRCANHPKFLRPPKFSPVAAPQCVQRPPAGAVPPSPRWADRTPSESPGAVTGECENPIRPRLPLYGRNRGVLAPALHLSETEAGLHLPVRELDLPPLPHPAEQLRRWEGRHPPLLIPNRRDQEKGWIAMPPMSAIGSAVHTLDHQQENGALRRPFEHEWSLNPVTWADLPPTHHEHRLPPARAFGQQLVGFPRFLSVFAPATPLSFFSFGWCVEGTVLCATGHQIDVHGQFAEEPGDTEATVSQCQKPLRGSASFVEPLP